MSPAEEQLRQERETFDLNKDQARRWFTLRLAVGYVALAVLPLLAIACGYVVFNSHAFGDRVVTAAVVVLGGDVLALLTATWKLVLSANSSPQLRPVTAVHGKAAGRPQAAVREVAAVDAMHAPVMGRDPAAGGQRRRALGRLRSPIRDDVR